MFKNRSLQVKVVKTPNNGPSAVPTITHKVDVEALIEKLGGNAKNVARAAVGAYIVVKGTDTACKMLMHIVATKIQ